MNTRLNIVKTVLWALMGILVVVTAARFLRGLGATTALTDATPWGFWIAFDVMSGVALAAGGFVVAGTVYVFGLERYRPFVRPAILTALLGYLAVAVGLLYDLGLPWNIWHPMIYQQYHSVLFEVAMCVMLYLTVLSLEFLPVVLEHPWLDYPILQKIHKIVKRAVIPLVITGIVLSTLHQSSLGSLFLITPYRLHALWYSPIIWVLFFVSAIGLGLMMVASESFFSAWVFGHKPRMSLLSGLGRAASVVLLLYVALRLGDLAARGKLGMAFDGTWQSFLFLAEILISAVIPATLLMFHRIRTSPGGLATCAAMTVFGMVMYRFDVCIVAFYRPESMPYFPSWMELAVSAGIVGGAMLVFIFFVEHLKVYTEEHDPSHAEQSAERFRYGPAATSTLLPDSLSGPRRYSLALVIAAAVTIAFLPRGLLYGTQVPRTPVSATRTLEGWMQEREEGPGHCLLLEKPEAAGIVEKLKFMSIDGNRNGRLVLFPHKYHIGTLGDGESCGQCHHLNMPFDENSSCFECHRDMYTTSDIFDHDSHIAHLKGNSSCIRCHQTPEATKGRATAVACTECHQDMTVCDSFIKPPEGGMQGFAVGYMDAMHNLCIGCHETTLDYFPESAECANCHRDIDGSRFREMKPYVVRQMEARKSDTPTETTDNPEEPPATSDTTTETTDNPEEPPTTSDTTTDDQ